MFFFFHFPLSLYSSFLYIFINSRLLVLSVRMLMRYLILIGIFLRLRWDSSLKGSISLSYHSVSIYLPNLFSMRLSKPTGKSLCDFFKASHTKNLLMRSISERCLMTTIVTYTWEVYLKSFWWKIKDFPEGVEWGPFCII